MQLADVVLLSGESASQRAMDVVANNIANMNTTGFKRESVAFASHMNKAGDISFATERGAYRDFSNGPIEKTNNQLDIAIKGEGFLEVQMPDGSTRYTRDGALTLNNTGQLVTSGGNPILAQGGQPLTLPNTISELNISADGQISAKTDPTSKDLALLGKIELVKFENPQALQATGENLYSTSQASEPATDYMIVQGALEHSNVEPIVEMTKMIEVSRTYERTSNLIGDDNTRNTDALDKLSKTTA
ncbi:MAG: flagellar basal-body rod protein FlgF [Alphaproteobacteria bacterium]|nr:flagellar basal-body rod protein FlgF [Alphaproteobacteria bacterium]MBV8548481.1 flagellar basal-body rod protein FlgF [Alphaproteobacteria bacterium]